MLLSSRTGIFVPGSIRSRSVARRGEERHANAKIIVLEGINLSLMVFLNLDPIGAIW
jgi:hypothetical protein